jgi:MFS family permease
MFVIAITLFIDGIGFGIVYPLLAYYAITFDVGITTLGLMTASFFVMRFFFSPILGRMSDKFGRRPVLITSIFLSLASYVLFAFADSFLLLLLSRIVAGLATEVAVAQAYIADITSEKQRAKGIGMLGATKGAGFIIGPGIAGLLSGFGYWAPGLVAAFLTFINLLFALFFLPETICKKSSEVQSSPSLIHDFFLKIKAAFSKPLIGGVLIIFFVVFLAFSAIPVIGTLFNQVNFGFGPVENSYVFMYIGVTRVFVQLVFIGKLTDMFSDEKLITFGPLLIASSFFFQPLTTNLLVYLGALAVMAAGIGIVNTVIPSYISKRTHGDEQGSILGVTNSVSNIAHVPGPIIGGFLFEFAGQAAPFFASAAILLIAFVIGLKIFFLKIGSTAQTPTGSH